MTGSKLALAFVLASCGSGDYPPFPGASPDGSADGLPPYGGDPAATDVTVTVASGGVVTPGVTVVFQDANSAVLAALVTDATGVAGATVAAGGFATVIVPDGGGARLFTFAATQPGDRLRLDIDAPTGVASSALSITVPTLANAIAFVVHSSCGDTTLDETGKGTLALVDCGSAADFIVVALDSDGQPFSSLSQAGVSTSGPVTLAGSYDAFVRNNFAYSNVPGSVAFVNTYEAIMSERGRLVDGTASAANGDGSAASSLELPSGSGLLALVASDAVPDTTQHGEQVVLDWGPWSPSYALDVGSALLRAYAGAPSYDLAKRAIVRDVGSAGVSPDSVRAALRVYRPAIPEGTSWRWSIVMPDSGAPLVFPALPALDGRDFNPGAADTVTFSELTSVKSPGGYAAFRQLGFGDVLKLVSGASGRVVVQRLFTPDPI